MKKIKIEEPSNSKIASDYDLWMIYMDDYIWDLTPDDFNCILFEDRLKLVNEKYKEE